MCFQLSNPDIDKAIDKYLERSLKIENVSFKEKDFKIYATRNIHKGAEIYLSYGSDYWLSKIAREMKEPLTRLFIWLKLGVLHIDSSETGRIILLENKVVSAEKTLAILSLTSDGPLMKYLEIDSLSPDRQLEYLMNYVK
jgi:hypothetical protein